MRKDEFLSRLEYLLQDVPEEDKNEALAYYLDCIEAAGPELEEETIENFGSPEYVAAIIRADLAGNLKESGSFTENGFEDERFKEPNFEVIESSEIPEADEEIPYRETYEKNRRKRPIDIDPERKEKKGRFWKPFLLGAILVVLSPFIFGAFGIVLGGLAAVLTVIIGAVVGIFCLTAIAFLVGVALAAVGVIFLLSTPLEGIFMIGIAITGLGFGLLGVVLLAVCFWLIGVIIPAVWKGCKMLFHLITGKGKEKANEKVG